MILPLTYPVRVRRYGGIDGEVSAYLITDANGRSVTIPCEARALRREVAKLFSPEEAEILAKWIARRLMDEWAIELRIAENCAGKPARTRGA